MIKLAYEAHDIPLSWGEFLCKLGKMSNIKMESISFRTPWDSQNLGFFYSRRLRSSKRVLRVSWFIRKWSIADLHELNLLLDGLGIRQKLPQVESTFTEDLLTLAAQLENFLFWLTTCNDVIYIRRTEQLLDESLVLAKVLLQVKAKGGVQ